MFSSEENTLQKDVMYVIKKGSFKEFRMKKFIVSGNSIYFTSDEAQSSFKNTYFYGGILTVSEDMIISVCDADYQEFDFETTIPVQSDDNMFVYPEQQKTSKLEYAIVPQVNCLWKSNGLYLDSVSELNTDDLKFSEKESYDTKGYFTDHASSLCGDADGNMF